MAEAASLESPRLKLSRAHGHLRALYDEINAFVNGPQAHEFVTEVENETRTETSREVTLVTRIKVLHELDPAWGLVFGDFIQNLRAALDHLVWQLVILSGNAPNRDNQFPIAWTGTRYWCKRKDGTPSVRDRALGGVEERYRAGIDAVQPYRAVGGPEESPLATIADFSNADKHRVVQPALTFALQPDESHYVVSAPVDGATVEIEQAVGRLEQGAHVVRATIRIPDPDAKVNVRGDIPVGIGFGERGLKAETLRDLYAFVRDYINSAESLFT